MLLLTVSGDSALQGRSAGDVSQFENVDGITGTSGGANCPTPPPAYTFPFSAKEKGSRVGSSKDAFGTKVCAAALNAMVNGITSTIDLMVFGCSVVQGRSYGCVERAVDHMTEGTGCEPHEGVG